jgi:hypothetical protein
VAVTETPAGTPKQNCDRGRDEVAKLHGTENTPGIASTPLRRLARNARLAVHVAPKSTTASRTAASQSGQGEQQVRSPTWRYRFGR